MAKTGYVYIMTNKTLSTLYIGVTSNLIKRCYEHRNGLIDGFTKTYHLHLLVYYEIFDCIDAAISREKQLKNWHRPWKINLVESMNPKWDDLYETILGLGDAETSSA